MVSFRMSFAVVIVAVASLCASTASANRVYTVRTWTKASGETISGRFERFDGQDVIISSAGKQVPVPFYDLNAGDQDFLRKGLAGGSSERFVPPPTAAAPAPVAPAVPAPAPVAAPVVTPAAPVTPAPVVQPTPAPVFTPAPAPPVVSPAPVPQPQVYYTPPPQSTGSGSSGGGTTRVIIPVGLIVSVLCWLGRSLGMSNDD